MGAMQIFVLDYKIQNMQCFKTHFTWCNKFSFFNILFKRKSNPSKVFFKLLV